ncbi:MAG: hypothetical protein FJZ93_10615 [Chloroflexi bacterium]|nr:hypothetical protein [Chloroflexota bacterium]
MAPKCEPIKAAVKYCGCCNPYVDLSSIARHLAGMAQTRGDFTLVPLSEDEIEVVVILCGCPRACGNKEEFKARAKHHLIVAGESINGSDVPETHLSTVVQRELQNILNR